MAAETRSNLTPTQRYAAGALFAIALHQAQINQTRPLGLGEDDFESTGNRISSSSGGSSDSVSEDPDLWAHENSGLLRPVFRFLAIETGAWTGLEETAGSTPVKHHVGAFMRVLSEENDENSSMLDHEIAVSKAVDAMVLGMETSSESTKEKKEKHREYQNETREKYSVSEQANSKSSKAKKEKSVEYDSKCHEKCSASEVSENSEVAKLLAETPLETGSSLPGVSEVQGPGSTLHEEPAEEATMLSYQRKVTVLYELLSACLADMGGDNKKCTRKRKGYDARHRVALRLLATWFNIEWIKMDAIEMMVACAAMALAKQIEAKEAETSSPKSKWDKWKRRGIIGAAALTGGTLMAITGGLAAPAIAAGFGALAPTLGTLIPVIGASGFAAVASAAGTVAGSVAVAASFGAAGAGLTGLKTARRTGSVDEFEFKELGENHNQGRLAVEIFVSGFVFEEDDFLNPWEGRIDNMERYALLWESKNLIAVSTAIQDFLTSRLAMELMRQGAMLTVLSSLLAALAWPATLLYATDLIDNKWAMAVDRSDKAGRLLAEVLLKELQGNRPVTLIGYSLGARVIFKCLQVLSETEHDAEIIERVVLLGAPISIQGENWEAARKMVAGRFVNAYSTSDWMLGVAFRTSLLTQGLAGIQPINVPGIENVDVTHLVEGHSSYLWATQQILEQLEMDAYFPVFRSNVHYQ